ncbi:MAG TPA: phenylalanine--tRNA ligase subunit alpha [Pyrinomonadaceae bacterium]|nr:phenylalanine--tRNA ligase subunit alpha [Pyrinomonadaceae bacterium]
MSSEALDYKGQVEAVREAFEQEFGRFARFRDDKGVESLTLEEAENALNEWRDFRTLQTSRKSAVAQLMKSVGRVPAEERAAFGQAVQQLNKEIDSRLNQVGFMLSLRISALKTERERVDVTLPGRRPRRGHLHPINIVRQRLEDIFVSMGYAVEDGPEVENDFYNFTALNIPELHPARSPQDTFYTTDGLALRSQTSTVQIHAMQRRRPPLRVVAPGRVFRRDTPDATHNPMFFQLEGLLVDRGIHMGHLKGTVTEFLRRLFGEGVRTRFRPSFFPFTEPSAEFDFTCFKCGGAGCRLCKGSGWIEMGGSGMVHPNVLRAVDIDPEEFSGFAFGFGIDRMCGLLYELDDIRLLFENDVRFLEQFD